MSYPQEHKELLESALYAIYNRQPIDNIKLNSRGTLLSALFDYCYLKLDSYQRAYINRNVNSINFDVSGFLIVTTSGSRSSEGQIFSLIQSLVLAVDRKVQSRIDRMEKQRQKEEQELYNKQQEEYQRYLNKLEQDRIKLERKQEEQLKKYRKKLDKEYCAKMAKDKKLSSLNDKYELSLNNIVDLQNELHIKQFLVQTTKTQTAIMRGRVISLYGMIMQRLIKDHRFIQYIGNIIRQDNGGNLIHPEVAEMMILSKIERIAEDLRPVYLGYTDNLSSTKITFYNEVYLPDARDEYLIKIKTIKVSNPNTLVNFGIELYKELDKLIITDIVSRANYLLNNKSKATLIDIELLKLNHMEDIADEINKRKGLLDLFGR